MGQTKSKTSVPETTLEPKIDIIGSKSLGYFGQVDIAKEQETGVQLYVKKFNYYTKEDFEQQLAHCYLRQCNPHPNLINIIGYKSIQEAVFCSEHYSITLYLETVEDTLEEKLAAHIESGECISEVELQLLGEQLVSILAQSQLKEIAHGDIRPATLFYTSEAYKLSDSTFSALDGASHFVRHAAAENCLLAPEVLKSYNGENQEITYNKYKADVFSVGATLLSLATLTKSEELYDVINNEINMELLETRIKAAESIYSNYFTTFLRATLEANPANRPDFCQLVGKFTISSALESYHVRTESQQLTANTPYVHIARHLLESKGGYYIDVEEIIKSLKQSQVSESPEKSGAQTQHATPDGKAIYASENRKRSGEPEILQDTPLKSSQIVSRA